jgi:pimeloyl-ACP methyl ester carboxylesterase
VPDAPHQLTDEPVLTRSTGRRQARGVVLMLHGGAERGPEPIDERSLSWRRSRWMMRQLERPLHAQGLDVWLLRYRVKGWNAGQGPTPSPVPDARWALDQVRDAHGDLPVVLLGHSMGGRTAVAVADDRSVLGVVALAPWLPPQEPVGALRGKTLVAAHGTRDRITSPRATAAFVHRAEQVAASAAFVEMPGLGHYMLRGATRWNRIALDSTLATFG